MKHLPYILVLGTVINWAVSAAGSNKDYFLWSTLIMVIGLAMFLWLEDRKLNQ